MSKSFSCENGFDELIDVLRECEDYFDNRADAEYTTDSAAPRPNEEMKLLMIVRSAIMKAELQHEDGKRQIC